MFGVYNIRDDLKNVLSTKVEPLYNLFDLSEDSDEIECIFIDWIPPGNEGFVRQAEIVENYVRKKIPTVIFDRFLSMTYKEYIWLKRFNVFFFEPAINNRIGFTYIPQWTTSLEENWDKEFLYKERSIDLFCTEDVNNKIKSFEKYYKEYASLYPEKNVYYFGSKKDYSNYNIKHANDFDPFDVKFVILIGSSTDYRIGYLPDYIFYFLKCGILPMLPIEHRFYSPLFGELVVKGRNDVDYFISGSSSGNHIRCIIIEDIFRNMEKYFPEFKINYIVDKIKFYLKV